MRHVVAALALGGLGLAAWLLLAIFGSGAMPAYFAAWLFWVGVPMGALPLVMTMEGAGLADSPLLPVLRRMLPLLPLATLLAVPYLIGAGDLFARSDVPGALPAWWTAPALLIGRDLAILVALSALALAFWRAPTAPRRGLAAFGLMLSLVLGSLVALDWIVAPQPALASSAAGLMLIAGQMAVAAALAGFVLAVGTAASARLPGGVGILLALVVASWAFLHFVQYLVVWSANLPNEAAWYLARSTGLGPFAVTLAAIAATLACAVLPSAAGRIPALLATVAATALLALLLSTLWLVTPGYRGTFALTLGDATALLGVGALMLAGLLAQQQVPR